MISIDLATKATTAFSVGDPGALAITPNGKTLYVSEIGRPKVERFTASTGVSLSTVTTWSDGATLSVTPDQAPVATLSVSPGAVGRTTTLSAVGSHGVSGPIVSYRWDFGDGKRLTSLLPTVFHTYKLAGIYTARVTETDSAGTSTTIAFTGQQVLRSGSPSAEATQTFQVQ